MARSAQTYPSDLAPEIQVALAALADVETRYDIEREAINRTGSAFEQERLRHQLEERHHAERGPLVQRLAELQQMMAFALMRRSWSAAPREQTAPSVEVEVERVLGASAHDSPRRAIFTARGHIRPVDQDAWSAFSRGTARRRPGGRS
jgi:hypothetical protein